MAATRTRTISACVLLSGLAFLYLSLGTIGLSVGLVVMGLVAGLEFAKLTFALDGDRGFLDYFVRVLFIFGILSVVVRDLINYEYWFAIIILIYILNLVVFFVKAISSNTMDRVVFNMMSFLFGVLYIGLPTYFFIKMLNGTDGLKWCVSLACITLAYDMAAYFSGIKWGKSKISVVSPHKTWEGFIGGFVATVFGSIFCFFVLSLQVQFWLFLLVCIFCGVVGQVGDLFESLIKRNANVKDSGYILPGHGGMLDRIDSMLFSTPIMFWLITRLYT